MIFITITLYGNSYRNRNARKATRKQTIKETHRLLNKERYITNLYSKKLSSPQLDVLSLGMTFAPSRDTSSSKLSESLNNFDRSNRLKFFFRKQPLTEPHLFKKKSAWMPPNRLPRNRRMPTKN